MGTMIGGHYIAYTLVDPEKMFEQGQEVVDAMRNMDLDNASAAEAEGLPRQPAPPARNGAKDRRVWCFCSEWVKLGSRQGVRIADRMAVHQFVWQASMKFWEPAHTYAS